MKCRDVTLRRSKTALLAGVVIAAFLLGVSVCCEAQAADITSGLVGWWKLDDGSGATAADSSGNGRHGTLLGMEAEDWVTAGKIGGALNFSGESETGAGTDRVQIPYDSAWQLGNSTTIALWYRRDVTDGPKDLLCHAKGSFPGWRIQNEGKFHIAAASPSQQDFYFTPAAVGTWGHVAVVLDRGVSPNKVYIYVNGVLDSGSAGTTYPANLTVGGDSDTGPLFFGARGGVPDERYDGLLDDVRVYSRALTADDVAALYLYEERPKLNTGGMILIR